MKTTEPQNDTVKLDSYKIRGSLAGGGTFEGFVRAKSKKDARKKCETNQHIASWEFIKK